VKPPPYPTELKPYGRALLELARDRADVLCLSADLTRQCEVDLFRDALPERFVNGGMAEQNLIGVAGGLARRGWLPFVHTFGVFCTRRPYDQVAMAVAYPDLPVRLVGFMPGLSSPGGPSHQATDDVALMRALPNMTVIDVADAVEVRQVVSALAELPGPAYLRLKRGETPVVFDERTHRFDLHSARVLRSGKDLALVTAGMMLPASIAAARLLEQHGVELTLVYAPVVKPLDTRTVLDACAGARAVLVAENHSVIGGLGSAVAETLAEAGLGRPLRRIGVQDTFAEGARTAAYLFDRYGLSTRAVVAAAWALAGCTGPAPQPPAETVPAGSYAPV
jgi:transketolase